MAVTLCLPAHPSLSRSPAHRGCNQSRGTLRARSEQGSVLAARARAQPRTSEYPRQRGEGSRRPPPPGAQPRGGVPAPPAPSSMVAGGRLAVRSPRLGPTRPAWTVPPPRHYHPKAGAPQSRRARTALLPAPAGLARTGAAASQPRGGRVGRAPGGGPRGGAGGTAGGWRSEPARAPGHVATGPAPPRAPRLSPPPAPAPLRGSPWGRSTLCRPILPRRRAQACPESPVAGQRQSG